MAAHAPFGPSKLKTIALCPGSWQAEQPHPDEQSIYAARGTAIHAVSEHRLMHGVYPIEHDLSSDEMEISQDYVAYVEALTGAYEVEVRVKPIPSMMEEIWGTADFVGFAPPILHVADLKTGSGVKVFAERNLQGIAYALGALIRFEHLGPFERVVIHIVQPPLNHYDTWEISVPDLYAYAGTIIDVITKAKDPCATRIPSDEACKFCKARHSCKERREANLAIAAADFAMDDIDALAELFPKLDGFISWAEDMKKHITKLAETGTQFPHLKLVEGRSVRVVADPAEAAIYLSGQGFPSDQYLSSKLKGIGDLEKLLGKKHEFFDKHVIRPRGKPVLVEESDPRPELSGTSSAIADFS